MEQTAIQIGNSTGVIIPSNINKKLGIKKGSKLYLEVTSDERLIISTKKGTQSITPEFLSWLESFNNEYGAALKELSEK